MTVDASMPPWAEAGERRRAHVARVVALLDAWADAMRLDDAERLAWRARSERAFIASTVPRDLDGAFRQVVRLRIETGLRDGRALHPRTVDLWNSLS